MPNLRILLPALLLTLGLPAMAQQVYRSTDAGGNVVFSDKPTPGSETITIDTPNIADPVRIPPASATPAPAPAPKPEPVIEAVPAPDGEITPDNRKGKKKKRKKRRKRYLDYEYGQ